MCKYHLTLYLIYWFFSAAVKTTNIYKLLLLKTQNNLSLTFFLISYLTLLQYFTLRSLYLVPDIVSHRENKNKQDSYMTIPLSSTTSSNIHIYCPLCLFFCFVLVLFPPVLRKFPLYSWLISNLSSEFAKANWLVAFVLHSSCTLNSWGPLC